METAVQDVKKQTVLCVDIGSSSLKTALIDNTGHVLAYERRKFDLSSPSSMWYNALCGSVHEILHKTSLKNPEAVSISGNGPTFCAQYNSGHTELVMWNDARFSDFPYKGKSLFMPRILSYLSKTESGTDTPVSLLSGPEYLVWQLCGEKTTLLPEERFLEAYWTKEDIDASGLAHSVFPPFIKLGQKSGTLTEKAGKDLGICAEGKDISVFCAGPDFTSALIGTNTLSPGLLCDRAGSSEGINVCTAVPLYTGGVRTLPSVISGLYNASILISDSGIRFSSLKKTSGFADASYKDYVSHLLENRTDTGYEQMIHLAKECGDALTKLISLYGKNIERRITVTGGQARNPFWLQVKSSIMNAVIDIPSCTDAELTGNAAVAFSGLGCFPDIYTASKSLFKIQMTLCPDGNTYTL